jgi:hypothetical protein
MSKRNKKLGLIIPYRNRSEHFRQFRFKVPKYLENKKIPYEIIFVDQDNAKLFNRGMLLNIGFKEAKKLECDYVVFHDVDMFPINVDYSYSDVPLHLATSFQDRNGMNKEIFDEYFGGVTLFPMRDFQNINGYSNKYWGWGYEDTDLLYRCIKKDIELDTLKIKNVGESGKQNLFFNGENSYVEGKNTIKLHNNVSIFVSFYSEDLTCDYKKDRDDFTIFSIPGYDFSISYNSFSRYNFCTFDTEKNVLFVNSKIRPTYKTNMMVILNNTEKIIRVYQDGKFIGQTVKFERLHSYIKEKNFYLGVGNPNRNEPDQKQYPNFYKGYIDSFIVFNSALLEYEVEEICNVPTLYKSDLYEKYKHNLEVYYDTTEIQDYKLIDLSGNLNSGRIVNCEIVNLEFNDFIELKVPHRRESVFNLLYHEENGFDNNKWKSEFTRYNQLRFHNEVKNNEDLINTDGLRDLEFLEHGKSHTDQITYINVGL